MGDSFFWFFSRSLSFASQSLYQWRERCAVWEKGLNDDATHTRYGLRDHKKGFSIYFFFLLFSALCLLSLYPRGCRFFLLSSRYFLTQFTWCDVFSSIVNRQTSLEIPSLCLCSPCPPSRDMLCSLCALCEQTSFPSKLAFSSFQFSGDNLSRVCENNEIFS